MGLIDPLKIFDSSYVFSELRVVRIVKLLLVSGPSAICRLVISLWVDAVDGVFGGGFWPHIRKKVYKTYPPSFANLDALRPIISITDIIRSGASLFHRAPRLIFRSSAPAVRVHDGANGFFMQTPAALCPQGS